MSKTPYLVLTTIALAPLELSCASLPGQFQRQREQCDKYGIPEDCLLAAKFTANDGDKERAAKYHARYRAGFLDSNCKRDSEECAVRKVWWSEDPIVQKAGIDALENRCASSEANALACLHLGDARAFGRGVPEDHALARASWQMGCAGGSAADVPDLRPAWDAVPGAAAHAEPYFAPDNRDERDDELARTLSCRRIANPSALYEDGETSPSTVHIVVPDGPSRLARAAELFAAGNPDLAFELAASVAGSQRETDPRAEAVALSQRIAMTKWESKVTPELKLAHYLRALDAAKAVAASSPLLDPIHKRVAAISVDAAAYHRAEAAKAGPSVAAVHLALARRFDPTLPRADASVSLDLSRLPAHCSWLAARLPEALGAGQSNAGPPARITLTCSHGETLDAPTTSPVTYFEEGSRNEIREVRKTTATKEEYKCIKNVRVPGQVGTVAEWGICERDSTESERVPEEVTVSSRTKRTGVATRQTRSLRSELRGSLQVGASPPTPFATTKVLQEVSTTTPGGEDVPFTSATVDTMDRQAAADSATAIRVEVMKLGASRGKTGAADRDEAFVQALLANTAPDAARVWLEQRFGITEAELRELIK